MQPKLRTTVAYIAGRIITGLETSTIHDHLEARTVSFEGHVTQASINVFSTDRGCYTTGAGEGNIFGLYDFGHGHVIDLEIDGNRFEGWDDLTPCRFSGEVTGSDISFYDDGDSKTFYFSFRPKETGDSPVLPQASARK